MMISNTQPLHDFDPEQSRLAGRRMDQREREKYYSSGGGSGGDPRLTKMLSWIAGVTSLTLVTILSFWLSHEDKYHDKLDEKLAALSKSIIVLENRPAGVSRDEFIWNMTEINQRMTEINQRFDTDEQMMRNSNVRK